MDELDGRLRDAERQQQPEIKLPQDEPQNRQEQPFAEKEGRPFSPSEQQPGRYDTLRTEATTEPTTREAGGDDEILRAMRAEREGKEPELGSAERDAAVLSALKGIFAIGEAENEPQQEVATNENTEAREPTTRDAGDDDEILQAMRAEREANDKAEAREPVTREAGDDDIVLQAMRAEREANGGTEAREPITRETGDDDFILQAIRAEREGKEPEAREPMTLDDIAERVQQLIDNPSLAGEEHDDVILQAMRARTEGNEFAQVTSQDYDPAPAQAEQQSDHTRSRTSADDHAGMGREENDAGEQEQERGDDAEEEHTLEQGGGGRERSLQ